jgi:cytoplasmic iron level regulating protein YaaA (DUF328/UPF0246 family)
VAIAVGTDADVANDHIAENNIASQIDEAQTTLEQQESDFENMKQNFSEATQIVARFTGRSYAGFQIWACGQ